MFQDLQSFFLFFLSKKLNSMKTSTQITSDPCNLVNRCNSGVTVLTEAGKKKQSEKRLSWGEMEGPSSHLSVLKVESVPEI